MRRLAGMAAVGVWFLGVTACIDFDRFRASDGAGDGGGGDVGPEACGDAGVCLSALPLGWSGPIALVDIDSGVDGCGGAFPSEVFRGDALLDVPDLSCKCTCDAPTGQTCPDPTFYFHANAGCTPAVNGSSFTPGQCVSGFSPSPPSAMSVRVEGGPATGGSCAPKPTEDRPLVVAERRIACGGAPPTTGECPDGEACVPVPGGSLGPRLCIWAEGDLPCPSGVGFTSAGVVYRGGYQDERSCSPCTCGAPSDGSCEGTSSLFNFTQCGGTTLASMPHDGTCQALQTSTFGSVRLVASTVVPGACTAAGASAQGEVVGSDPVTVCCTPSL